MVDVLTKSRTEQKSSNFRQFFRDLSLLALTLLPDGSSDVGSGLTLQASGAVTGFDQWLSRNVHRGVAGAWTNIWAWMADDANGGLVSQDVFAEQVSPRLKDLVIFAVGFIPAFKKVHGRMPSVISASSIKELQWLILKFLANIVETVVLNLVTQQDDVPQPLPGLRLRRLAKACFSFVAQFSCKSPQLLEIFCSGWKDKRRA